MREGFFGDPVNDNRCLMGATWSSTRKLRWDPKNDQLNITLEIGGQGSTQNSHPFLRVKYRRDEAFWTLMVESVRRCRARM